MVNARSHYPIKFETCRNVSTLVGPQAREGHNASALPQARKLIAQRDPDDVGVLALTIQSGLPLWSNDNDFEDTGIERYTAAELLQKPGGAKQNR